jgi:hypothetical protein
MLSERPRGPNDRLRPDFETFSRPKPPNKVNMRLKRNPIAVVLVKAVAAVLRHVGWLISKLWPKELLVIFRQRRGCERCSEARRADR